MFVIAIVPHLLDSRGVKKEDGNRFANNLGVEPEILFFDVVAVEL